MGLAAVLVILAVLAVRLLPLHDDEPGRTRTAFTQPPRTLSPRTLYALRLVQVHSGAGSEFSEVRTLARGERVVVGQRNAAHWVALLDRGGDTTGFAYESPENFGSVPPNAVDTTAICRDGSISFSRHASGTCAGKNGVRTWIHHPDST